MTPEPNTLILETLNKLNAAENNPTTKTIDLGDYGTSYELTEHDSHKKLILTPTEDNLIDMILYDKTGTTIATCTLFEKAVTDITPEKLATLMTICF